VAIEGDVVGLVCEVVLVFCVLSNLAAVGIHVSWIGCDPALTINQ
jgi:hypothetical protein